MKDKNKKWIVLSVYLFMEHIKKKKKKIRIHLFFINWQGVK